LASIISVMLGVATMIVVNAVMSGFTTEMQERIHGILSDVVFEGRSFGGFADAAGHMERINEVAGEWIEAMSPTVVVPGALNYQVGGEWMTQQVQIIGIEESTQGQVSDFRRYLQHPANRAVMSFELQEDGYDVVDHQAEGPAPERPQMAQAGRERRRFVMQQKALREAWQNSTEDLGSSPYDPFSRYEGRAAATPQGDKPPASNAAPGAAGNLPGGREPGGSKPGAATPAPSTVPVDPFRTADINRPGGTGDSEAADPVFTQHTGTVLGMALASVRCSIGEDEEGAEQFEERFLVLPGDDVVLTFPTVSLAALKPEIGFVDDKFTVVDLYESKMSEYDSNFVFVPIRELQRLRGMIDPETKVAYVNSIQIKLKEGADGEMVRNKIRAAFPLELYSVNTWRDKQGALLAAVDMESAILNVLLFLIIAVAGFGILAIFFMIVVEKTRDIGVLKSLGASAGGVMSIFLVYGLALGLLGSGVGTAIGLVFVGRINEIADWLGRVTGRPVFDPEIYYFYKIPVIVSPWTVGWIVAGAVVIAVLASVLPAYRAARLHPVEALRYE
jgi:lipoprotein-releasing system permease protein